MHLRWWSPDFSHQQYHTFSAVIHLMTATFGIAATHFPRSAIGAMNATSLIPWGGFGVYLKYFMIRETTKSPDIDKKQLRILAILRHTFDWLLVYAINWGFHFFLDLFPHSFRYLFLDSLIPRFICLLNTCTAIEDSIGAFSSVYIYILWMYALYKHIFICI